MNRACAARKDLKPYGSNMTGSTTIMFVYAHIQVRSGQFSVSSPLVFGNFDFFLAIIAHCDMNADHFFFLFFRCSSCLMGMSSASRVHDT